MYIRKITEGSGIPSNAVLDGYSASQTGAYSCNYINKITNYSTTEQIIGKWIDEKPIYRKVITGSTANQTSTVIGNISSVDNMIHIYGFCNVQDGEHKNIPCIEGSNYISACMLPNGNVRIDNTTSNYFRGSAVVIVEYTKTTD